MSGRCQRRPAVSVRCQQNEGLGCGPGLRSRRSRRIKFRAARTRSNSGTTTSPALFSAVSPPAVLVGVPLSCRWRPQRAGQDLRLGSWPTIGIDDASAAAKAHAALVAAGIDPAAVRQEKRRARSRRLASCWSRRRLPAQPRAARCCQGQERDGDVASRISVIRATPTSLSSPGATLSRR